MKNIMIQLFTHYSLVYTATTIITILHRQCRRLDIMPHVSLFIVLQQREICPWSRCSIQINYTVINYTQKTKLFTSL